MTEETIFLAALGKKDTTERAAYLDTACAGEPALRQRIEALLRSHADPDSFLDVPALARQASVADDSARTTALPAAGEKSGTPVLKDEALAYLAPTQDPCSLGRLDHYEVLEVVGRGGMGIVFRARDIKLQRIVAIKVLAPALAANGSARKRFVREAQAAAAVRDDHVVSIHAVSDEGMVPYLVMEFIAGSTLADRVKQYGSLAVTEILRIGLQSAKGLAAAHSQGLIHRDIKPGNILLENGVQRVKITDFGLARAVDDSSLTQSGVIAGTPLFMSPEQARGEALDQRSDLFSLGSVLYTLCTGRPAFRGRNALAVMKRVCDDEPQSVREVNADIPDWLAAIVGKLLAKNPADRFRSAAELGELLGGHLACLQQPRLASPAAPQAETVSSLIRSRRRFKVTAVLVGVVGILVIAGVLSRTWLFPPRDGRPQGSTAGSKKDTSGAPEDPRVLTVSKKPEAGGRFRTITEALNEVLPGMTIRILDDAVYEEDLLINRPEQYRGVVLEAVAKATLRPRLDKDRRFAVSIVNVPGFSLRGLCLESSEGPYTQVGISRSCPGVVLDKLTMTGGNGNFCVAIWDVSLSVNDAPIVIRDCTMRGASTGVQLDGSASGNYDRPLRCGHMVIRDNTMIGLGHGVHLNGAAYRTHVVANRILDSSYAAIDLFVLPGMTEVLVANNTLVRNRASLRLWDDSTKGKDFLNCKNMRFHNNLVLDPAGEADLMFWDHRRGNFDKVSAGDVPALLKSPEWRFSHNWREVDQEKAATRFPGSWIPRRPNDHLQIPIKVLSRKPAAPNFLRLPKDSPLAKGGAGVADLALPAYVGAVPPEGVEPWDWRKTWKMLNR